MKVKRLGPGLGVQEVGGEGGSGGGMEIWGYPWGLRGGGNLGILSVISPPMSYDLYFTSPRISRAQFRSYFSERPLYKISESQAWYENDDTGVYFSFEYNDCPPGAEDDVDYLVRFNMNYYRPHYFGLEAEPEVSAFVQRFGFAIYDPQTAGMDTAPYTPEGLLRGWNHGNEVGYRAVLGREDAPAVIHTWPTDDLERIWRWNFLKESRGESGDKIIYISKLGFALFGGQAASFCVWPDGLSALIPKADYLWIPREKLAPKPWFGKGIVDECIIPFNDALGVLERYRVDGYELEAFEVLCLDIPTDIKTFVQKLPPRKNDPPWIPMDQVLNRELVGK